MLGISFQHAHHAGLFWAHAVTLSIKNCFVWTKVAANLLKLVCGLQELLDALLGVFISFTLSSLIPAHKKRFLKRISDIFKLLFLTDCIILPTAHVTGLAVRRQALSKATRVLKSKSAQHPAWYGPVQQDDPAKSKLAISVALWKQVVEW